MFYFLIQINGLYEMKSPFKGKKIDFKAKRYSIIVCEKEML